MLLSEHQGRCSLWAEIVCYLSVIVWDSLLASTGSFSRKPWYVEKDSTKPMNLDSGIIIRTFRHSCLCKQIQAFKCESDIFILDFAVFKVFTVLFDYIIPLRLYTVAFLLFFILAWSLQSRYVIKSTLTTLYHRMKQGHRSSCTLGGNWILCKLSEKGAGLHRTVNWKIEFTLKISSARKPIN